MGRANFVGTLPVAIPSSDGGMVKERCPMSFEPQPCLALKDHSLLVPIPWLSLLMPRKNLGSPAKYSYLSRGQVNPQLSHALIQEKSSAGEYVRRPRHGGYRLRRRGLFPRLSPWHPQDPPPGIIYVYTHVSIISLSPRGWEKTTLLVPTVLGSKKYVFRLFFSKNKKIMVFALLVSTSMGIWLHYFDILYYYSFGFAQFMHKILPCLSCISELHGLMISCYYCWGRLWTLNMSRLVQGLRNNWVSLRW